MRGLIFCCTYSIFFSFLSLSRPYYDAHRNFVHTHISIFYQNKKKKLVLHVKSRVFIYNDWYNNNNNNNVNDKES